MRSDQQRQEAVLKALDREPSVNAAQIGVTVQQGVVTLGDRAGIDAKRIAVEARNGTVVLKGTVHSLSERAAAEHAVWAAPSVIALDDRLVVAP